MIAVQIVTARDLRRTIDSDGHIVADARGAPVAHPAIALEAAAQSRARDMLDSCWSHRLFAESTGEIISPETVLQDIIADGSIS